MFNDAARDLTGADRRERETRQRALRHLATVLNVEKTPRNSIAGDPTDMMVDTAPRPALRGGTPYGATDWGVVRVDSQIRTFRACSSVSWIWDCSQ